MDSMATKSSAGREDRVTSKDGLRIFYRAWTPANARGVVLIVPGFNSHSGYYLAFGEALARRGLAAYAVDLRGRGQSDGERFYVQKYDDYVADVRAVAAKAKSDYPNLPVFIYGHSAGGVAACLYTLAYQPELAGLLCASFAFQTPAPDFAVAALKGLAHLAPHAHVLHLKNEQFSRDPAVVKKMNEDPLIAHETQPTQTIAELARADERLKQGFASITLPVLIMHGTADSATKPSGSQLFYDTTGAKDKTLKLYDGHYHDMLNDLGREAVQADILAWLDKHLPA